MFRVKTLKGCILFALSYTETKDLCLQYPSLFGSPWYDSWVWKEKALADFNISGEFFDLVSDLPPSQRYLQIKSYHVLTPDMAVRLHPDGFIEGVYEAMAGYRRAKREENKEMKIFFANRLKPEQIKILNREGRVHKPDRTLDQSVIDKLNRPQSYKPPSQERHSLSGLKRGRKDRDFLYMILESGRIDWLDQILHRYFVLPPGFTIHKDIPHTPFWAKEFPIYKLEAYQGEELDLDDLYSYMFQACDSRVVDFLRSILDGKTIPREHNSLLGCFAIKNPEETFAIYKRLGDPDDPYLNIPPSLEKVLDRGEGYYQMAVDNLGNIPLLLALLPFLTREEVEWLVENYGTGYPLTEKILEAYLED